MLIKDYSRYPTCCMGVLDGQRCGSKPHAPSPKFGTAVQSYVDTITQPAVHEYIFVHQDHSAKSNEQSPQ